MGCGQFPCVYARMRHIRTYICVDENINIEIKASSAQSENFTVKLAAIEIAIPYAALVEPAPVTNLDLINGVWSISLCVRAYAPYSYIYMCRRKYKHRNKGFQRSKRKFVPPKITRYMVQNYTYMHMSTTHFVLHITIELDEEQYN